MKSFIDNVKEPHNIGPYIAFMSSFLGARVLFGSLKNFALLFMLSLSMIISCIIPLLAFVTIPAFLTAVLLIAIKTLYAQTYTISDILKAQAYRLSPKVISFSILSLVPLSVLIASGTNLYYAITPMGVEPMAIYLLLIAIFIALLWGVVIAVANIFSLKKDLRTFSVITEAIDALIKNPFIIFMTLVQWFLTFIMMYFVMNIAIIGTQVLLGSMPLVLAISNYLVALLVIALFLSFYLSHIAALAIFITANDNNIPSVTKDLT